MYIINTYGEVEYVEQDHFENEINYLCFIWKRQYNIDIAPFDEYDVSRMNTSLIFFEKN